MITRKKTSNSYGVKGASSTLKRQPSNSNGSVQGRKSSQSGQRDIVSSVKRYTLTFLQIKSKENI